MSCSQPSCCPAAAFLSHSRILSRTGKAQLQRYQRHIANLIACEMSYVPVVRLCLSCLLSKQDAVFWRMTGDKTGEEREEDVWTDWLVGFEASGCRDRVKTEAGQWMAVFCGLCRS